MTDDDIVQDILPDYESMRYKNNMNESYNAMIVNDTDSNNVLLVITTDQLVSMQYLFLFVIFLFEYFFINIVLISIIIIGICPLFWPYS